MPIVRDARRTSLLSASLSVSLRRDRLFEKILTASAAFRRVQTAHPDWRCSLVIACAMAGLLVGCEVLNERRLDNLLHRNPLDVREALDCAVQLRRDADRESFQAACSHTCPSLFLGRGGSRRSEGGTAGPADPIYWSGLFLERFCTRIDAESTGAENEAGETLPSCPGECSWGSTCPRVNMSRVKRMTRQSKA